LRAVISKSGGSSDYDNYDPAGNITEIDKYRVGVEADNGLFKYAYDPLNRLVEANGNKYAYDAVGNRVESLINGTASKHEFNAKNQLIKTFEGDNTTTYSYDKRGNLIAEILNGQLKASYTFDATNMMIGATTPKGTASYGYDGFRNRVKKLENMTDVRFINDMTLPFNNLLSVNSQNFVWGNGLLTANAPNSNYHYLQDHLGSPVRLLGADSDIAQAFDEFGVPKFDDIATGQPFGFTGYQTDAVSGLQYAQARYYNPVAGRFTAEDIIKGHVRNPLSLNTYVYCYNSPHVYVDLDGLSVSGVFEMPDINLNDIFANIVISIADILTPNDVVGVGMSGTLAVIGGVTGQGNVVADPQGNVGVMLFIGAGAAVPQASYNYNVFAMPGTDRIHDLGHIMGQPGTFRGTFSGVVGGSSAYKGISVGIDAIHNLDGITGYQLNAGFGLSLPVSVHGMYGVTIVQPLFNINDIVDQIFDILNIIDPRSITISAINTNCPNAH